jgi:ribosomal protein S18 acetylase RimI-like enzyme
LRALLEEARRRGLHTVVLETAAHWDDARSFYEGNGFVFDHEEDGEFCRDTYSRLDLRG